MRNRKGFTALAMLALAFLVVGRLDAQVSHLQTTEQLQKQSNASDLQIDSNRSSVTPEIVVVNQVDKEATAAHLVAAGNEQPIGNFSQEEEESLLNGAVQNIPARDILRMSPATREKILQNPKQYPITKGTLSLKELQRLSVTSQMLVKDHPELFEIK